MSPSPGMTLNRKAISARIPFSRRMIPLPSSDAPQSLQKLAPSTITGSPHREQKRGLSKKSASGTEGKRSVADPHRVSVFQWSFADPLAAHEGSVLAPQITQSEAAVGGLDCGMMARDRGVSQHDIVVERAPDLRFLSWLNREALAAGID